MLFFFLLGLYFDFFLLTIDIRNKSIYRMDLNSYSYEVVFLYNYDNSIFIDFDS